MTRTYFYLRLDKPTSPGTLRMHAATCRKLQQNAPPRKEMVPASMPENSIKDPQTPITLKLKSVGRNNPGVNYAQLHRGPLSPAAVAQTLTQYLQRVVAA